MKLNEYQGFALETAQFPEKYKIIYPALGLCEEAGEVAGKIKKIIRDDASLQHDANGAEVFTPEQIDAIALELGDVLWYVAILSHKLGLDLQHVACMNIAKLADRKARGVLGGSGDNR